MSALVIAEHDNSTLHPATARAVLAARQCAENVEILVAGAGAQAVAESAAMLAGVSRVLHVEAKHYADFLAEQVAPLIAREASRYSHVLMAATTTGRDVMPRVAGLLGLPMVTEAVRIVAPDTFVRPIYAGNALETVQVAAKPVLLTIRATAFDASSSAKSETVVELLPSAPENALSQNVSRETLHSSRPDLGNARVVVAGGRGFGSAENFKKLEHLADKLGAAIGASRAAVDAGFAPNAWQVGQTGKVVAPELYIAIGISGAIQHLAGMKDSRVIVAINRDEKAPIFEIADFGLVADLDEALPALEKALDA